MHVFSFVQWNKYYFHSVKDERVGVVIEFTIKSLSKFDIRWFKVCWFWICIHTSVRDFRVCDWLKDHTWPCINTVHSPANNQYLSIFGTIFRNRWVFLINVNPTLLKLIILSWFILLEKYDNISENVMLKNSKCVINICCYAPRRMYTQNAHPCFEWYIPSKSPILRELLNVESGNINGGFSSIFGRLKVWICKIMV